MQHGRLKASIKQPKDTTFCNMQSGIKISPRRCSVICEHATPTCNMHLTGSQAFVIRKVNMHRTVVQCEVVSGGVQKHSTFVFMNLEWLLQTSTCLSSSCLSSACSRPLVFNIWTSSSKSLMFLSSEEILVSCTSNSRRAKSQRRSRFGYQALDFNKGLTISHVYDLSNYQLIPPKAAITETGQTQYHLKKQNKGRHSYCCTSCAHER